MLCTLPFVSAAKFDERGRQRSVRRLSVHPGSRIRSLERLVDLVAATIKVPICAISIIDQDRQWFLAQRGLEIHETAREVAFCNHTIRTESPLIIPDTTIDPIFCNSPLVTSDPGLQSYLGIPLKLQDGYIIGALCVADTKPRGFFSHQVKLLKDFAKTVIQEIELLDVNSLDGETGFPSRAAWAERFQYDLSRAKRRESHLCTLILDLDRFDEINRLRGDMVGDFVVERVAELIRLLLPEGASVGRIGGGAFGICLPGQSFVEAWEFAEHARRAIASLTFSEHPGLRCTASVGGTCLKPSDSRDEILRRTDHALHRAKSKGRNTVWLA